MCSSDLALAVARSADAPLHYSTRKLRLMNTSCQGQFTSLRGNQVYFKLPSRYTNLNLIEISPYTPVLFLVNAIDHQGPITITNVVLIH